MQRCKKIAGLRGLRSRGRPARAQVGGGSPSIKADSGPHPHGVAVLRPSQKAPGPRFRRGAALETTAGVAARARFLQGHQVFGLFDDLRRTPSRV
eukprot:10830338-Alexandrium_andersonii.AAC.1